MRPNKLEQPQKTFFFERDSGEIFAVGEQEAWSIFAGNNQVVGLRNRIPKLVGVSDGRKMHQAVLESHEIYKTDPAKALERIREGYDEELKSSLGHIERPRNFDKMGPGASFL